MPEFLQKAIGKAKCREDKAIDGLDELEALRAGEIELNEVAKGPASRFFDEPSKDARAAFKESGRRATEIMRDEDVEKLVMGDASLEDKRKDLEQFKNRFEDGLMFLREDLLKSDLFEKVSITPEDIDKIGTDELVVGVMVHLKPEMDEKWDNGFRGRGDYELCYQYDKMIFSLASFAKEFGVISTSLSVFKSTDKRCNWSQTFFSRSFAGRKKDKKGDE